MNDAVIVESFSCTECNMRLVEKPVSDIHNVSDICRERFCFVGRGPTTVTP